MESKQDFHTVPFLDKSPCEDPHESSQTHQLHPKFLQHAINGAVKLCSAPVQFVVDHLGGIRHTTSINTIQVLGKNFENSLLIPLNFIIYIFSPLSGCRPAKLSSGPELQVCWR